MFNQPSRSVHNRVLRNFAARKPACNIAPNKESLRHSRSVIFPLMRIDNLRITKAHALISPAQLAQQSPLTASVLQSIAVHRKSLEAIMDGEDQRLAIIMGPCSIHDPKAALDYAGKLYRLSQTVSDKLFIIMRVYFEKPRTVVGWKGLINDPHLDGSCKINEGLSIARKLLIDINSIGLPTGTEFLDTILGQYYADLITWGAIGARTAESQVHRELASGLSMPVGIKNRTDGNVQVAVEACQASREKHLFPSLTKQGVVSILETSGNPYAHLVLRGGSESGSNYDAESLAKSTALLEAAELPPRIMLDCSHANSGKCAKKQIEIAMNILRQNNPSVFALMLESNLMGGRQNDKTRPLEYGQSITDECLGWKESEELIRQVHTYLGDPG